MFLKVHDRPSLYVTGFGALLEPLAGVFQRKPVEPAPAAKPLAPRAPQAREREPFEARFLRGYITRLVSKVMSSRHLFQSLSSESSG